MNCIISKKTTLGRVTWDSSILYVLLYGGYIKLLFPTFRVAIMAVQVCGILAGLISLGRRNFIIFTDKTRRHALFAFTLMLVYIAVCAIVFALVSNNQYGFEKLEGLLPTVGYILAIIGLYNHTHTDDFFQKYFKLAITTNVVVCTLYSLLHVNEFVQVLSQSSRLGGSETNPIWIARMCCETAVMIFAERKAKLCTKEWFVILGLITLSFTTGSKGPIVCAIVVGLYYYFFVLDNKVAEHKLLVLVASIISAVLIVSMFSGSDNAFIQQRFSIESILTSDPGYRLDRYIYTAKNILQRPFWGHGFGTWGTAYWSQASSIPSWMNVKTLYADYPHNYILELWYESGIVPIMLFFYTVYCCGRFTKLNKYKHWAMQTVWLLLLINIGYSMTSGSIFSGNQGVYYYLTLIITMNVKRSLR